ncbi:MAG: hypothetical protein ACI9VR_003093 [Cognaticolwellia sp.]|jgi:hypothetical protein
MPKQLQGVIAAVFGLLGVPLSMVAFCVLMGLGAVRQAPASALAISAMALVTLPVMGLGMLAKPRLLSTAVASLFWPIVFLMALPMYFPGQRAPALSTGMSALGSLGGEEASISGADLGTTLSTFFGPEWLAGRAPAPKATPKTPPAERSAEPPPRPAPIVALGQGESIHLPYEGQGRSLRIPVGLEHDGQDNERWMLFDTGATFTTLTREALATLGVEIPGNAPTAQLHTANGITQAPLVLIDKVWLGGFAVDNVTIAVCDLCGNGDNVGLLGLNVSGQFTVTFDPGQAMLELTPQDGQRTLDMSHWVHISGLATAFPDGRVEVRITAENDSQVPISELEVGIQCADEHFSAHLEDVPAQGEEKTRVTLPRGTDCDPYQITLDGGQW